MVKPTISDVARLAGVSRKTVSRVIDRSPLLNDAIRAKVEQVIAETGYVPDPEAEALALLDGRAVPAGPTPAELHARRQLIALVYDFAVTAQLPDALLGIQSALRGTDFSLVVMGLDRGGDDIAAELRVFLNQQRPSGVVVVPPLAEIAALAGLFEEFGCEHLFLGAGTPDPSVARILSDDRTAAAQAVDHLVSLGHERIGMVAGPEESRIAQQRELGYLDAMADHELDRGPALIANGDNSFMSGYKAGYLLLEVSPRPTAILAANDEMAAGIYHAAAAMEITVPDGLSVIGFEDAAIASRLSPQLTTVRVPLAEMAHAAALRLIAPDEDDTQPPAFAAELITRGSTGPCPT